MLKLLLVDDEQPILDGLKQLIEWDRFGVAAIETAGNGREALAVARDFRPDIMITDIRMPFMNGIELLKAVREILPDIVCIVLCGYQDFEYVRDSMKYGAVRYLLKPVDEDELREIIGSVRNAHLNASREKERMAEINRKLVESTPFLRNKLLYSILCGEITDKKEIEEKLAGFGIKRFPEHFICAVIEFETGNSIEGFGSENIELIRFAAANIADELVNASAAGLVFYMIETQIIVLIDGKSCQPHIAETVLRDIIHYISSHLKLPVTIGRSSVYEGLENVPRSYREAKSALKYKLLAGKGKIIHYDEVSGSSDRSVLIPVSCRKRLENSLITGDSNSVPTVVGDLFSELKAIRGVKPAEILSKCREELILVRRSMEDMGLNVQTMNRFIDRFDNELQGLTLDELRMRFTEAFREIAGEIAASSSAGIRAIISQVRQYIDNNYDSQITLNTIAEKFYINSSYASRLIKQELSENFIDYLTNKRMNEAIRLLTNTEMSIYEISEKTGYGNPKYFSQLFKRHTGLSPREYRENARK